MALSRTQIDHVAARDIPKMVLVMRGMLRCIQIDLKVICATISSLNKDQQPALQQLQCSNRRHHSMVESVEEEKAPFESVESVDQHVGTITGYQVVGSRSFCLRFRDQFSYDPIQKRHTQATEVHFAD